MSKEELERLWQDWLKAHQAAHEAMLEMTAAKVKHANAGYQVNTPEWYDVLKAIGAFKQAHGAEQAALAEYTDCAILLES